MRDSDEGEEEETIMDQVRLTANFKAPKAFFNKIRNQKEYVLD